VASSPLLNHDLYPPSKYWKIFDVLHPGIQFLEEGINRISRNEQLRDLLLDLLENARREIKEKKPPPFEIDLEIHLTTTGINFGN